MAIPLGTFPDIQPIEDCGRSAVLNFLHNSLRTTARCSTIEAFVTCPVPNHERATFRTRRRIFLQSEWKALFRNRRDMPVSWSWRTPGCPALRQEPWEKRLCGPFVSRLNDPNTHPVFLIEEFGGEPAEDIVHD